MNPLIWGCMALLMVELADRAQLHRDAIALAHSTDSWRLVDKIVDPDQGLEVYRYGMDEHLHGVVVLLCFWAGGLATVEQTQGVALVLMIVAMGAGVAAWHRRWLMSRNIRDMRRRAIRHARAEVAKQGQRVSP